MSAGLRTGLRFLKRLLLLVLGGLGVKSRGKLRFIIQKMEDLGEYMLSLVLLGQHLQCGDFNLDLRGAAPADNK